MTQVTIRQLTHGFSGYLKAVQRGERIVILNRNVPVADLLPHNENLSVPGWKRPIKKLKLKGESFSQIIRQMRDEERY